MRTTVTHVGTATDVVGASQLRPTRHSIDVSNVVITGSLLLIAGIGLAR